MAKSQKTKSQKPKAKSQMAKVEKLMHDTNTWRDRHPIRLRNIEARTQMANSQNTNGQTTPIHLQKGPDTPHGLPFSFFSHIFSIFVLISFFNLIL